jgi:hypothetical protein
MVSSERLGTSKKLYKIPRLRLYGDIRTVTKSIAMGGLKLDAMAIGLKTA